MTTKTFVPYGNRVLVLPKPVETKTASGFILPDAAKGSVIEGIILSAGSRRNIDGTEEKIRLAENTEAVIAKTGIVEIKLNGIAHYVVREDDIIGTFEEK